MRRDRNGRYSTIRTCKPVSLSSHTANAESTKVHTNKHIIPNLHVVVVDLAPADSGGGLDDAAGGDDGAAADDDAGGALAAGLRGGGSHGPQVAAQLHVGHDYRAAAELDVGGAGYGGAAGDFVAGVLGVGVRITAVVDWLGM